MLKKLKRLLGWVMIQYFDAKWASMEERPVQCREMLERITLEACQNCNKRVGGIAIDGRQAQAVFEKLDKTRDEGGGLKVLIEELTESIIALELDWKKSQE